MFTQEIKVLADTITNTFQLHWNMVDFDVKQFIEKKQGEGYNLAILNEIIINHKDKILEITIKENIFNDDRFYTYGIVSLICRMSKFKKYTD